MLSVQGVIPAGALNCVDDLFVAAPLLPAAKQEAKTLLKLSVTKLDMQWLQVLSEGWATPLTGFMSEKQYLQCQHFGCLLDGVMSNQSVPIVLPVSEEDKQRLNEEMAITLVYEGR